MAGSIDDMGTRNSPTGSQHARKHQDPLLTPLSSGAGAATTKREAMLMRRSRGRPAGSKNKPKPPIIVTRDSANALRANAMEVSSGCDICESLINFARKKQRGIFILRGMGCVMNITLRQPINSSSTSSSTSSDGNVGNDGAIMTHLHGQFEIVSLMGSVLPPPAPPGVTGLTIYVSAGPQGQVIGGSVAGALLAAGPVVIMAAIFMTAAFDHLPLSPSASEFEDCDYDDQVGARGKGNNTSNPLHQNNNTQLVHNYYQSINSHVPPHQQLHHQRVDVSDLYGKPHNLVTDTGTLAPVNAYAWPAGKPPSKN